MWSAGVSRGQILTQSDLPKAEAGGRVQFRRALLFVRHHGFLAGRGRTRALVVAGDDRPAALPSSGRPSLACPARCTRCDELSS